MIRINLLPAREAKRRSAVRRQVVLAACLLLAALGLGVWGYTVQAQQLTEHRDELARIEAELKRLESIIKEVQQFEAKKGLLERKVVAIEDIKTKQQRPARLLDEISRSLPEQLWVLSIRETASQVLQISGKAFDNVGIAAFMENLERTTLFTNVELVESKSELLQGRQVVAFTVTARTNAAPSKKKEATS